METYDILIIGSGHNALITAAYLTRAGRSVLVLEKNDRPGGYLRTDEVTVPGFKHDVYAAAHPLLLTRPAYADLGKDLEARGLHYVNTDLPTGVSMDDGRRKRNKKGAVHPCPEHLSVQDTRKREVVLTSKRSRQCAQLAINAMARCAPVCLRSRA